MATVRPPRGFTLIELMIVVSIVGVLSTVAIPSFQRSVLRTKVAERATIMVRIKHAIQDHYVRNGSLIVGGGTVDSGWNPSFPPTMSKRPMSASQPVWNTYFMSALQEQVMGSVYYSYRFTLTEAGGSSSITILAAGDLDGDSAISTKRLDFARSSAVFQLVAEFPPAGQEDDGSPARTF